MLTSLLFISVCFLAYANGANDNFKGVASLFGSSTLHYRLALTWATVTTLAGSIAALFLAQSLLVKFSGNALRFSDFNHPRLVGGYRRRHSVSAWRGQGPYWRNSIHCLILAVDAAMRSYLFCCNLTRPWHQPSIIKTREIS